MRKLSIILLIASLIGAFVFIGVDISRSSDFGELKVTAIASLVALPFVIYYVVFCPGKIMPFIVGSAAGICTLATLAIVYISYRGIKYDFATWRDESWLFITGFTLFGSVATFLWCYFSRLRHVQDA